MLIFTKHFSVFGKVDGHKECKQQTFDPSLSVYAKVGKELDIRPRHGEDCLLACKYQDNVEPTGCTYDWKKKTCYVHTRFVINKSWDAPFKSCWKPILDPLHQPTGTKNIIRPNSIA